jgi:hypothetical protein
MTVRERILAGGLALAGLIAATRAAADGPTTSECVTIAAISTVSDRRASKEAADASTLLVSNYQSVAGATSGWLDLQLAAGRTHIVTATIGTNASVFCAW